MMLPTSLLTSMRLTRMVFSLTASKMASSEMRPVVSTGSRTTSKPSASSRFMHSSTLGCSTAVVTIRLPRRFSASTVPKTAMLLLSVPPAVKYTSCGLQPNAEASVRRAASSCSFAASPTAWREEGLPHVSVMARATASTASGSGFVVALLSKYAVMTGPPRFQTFSIIQKLL